MFDIYHRYLTQEKMEIVAIAEQERIIHYIDNEFTVSTCPHLSQELESGDVKYIVEY